VRGMEPGDVEIFLNIFFSKVKMDKDVTPDIVYKALSIASGTVMDPRISQEHIPMYCASSISKAISEKRFEDLGKLLNRAIIGIEESFKNSNMNKD
jgi:hypothetical protein